jgi:hypothetical protein
MFSCNYKLRNQIINGMTIDSQIRSVTSEHRQRQTTSGRPSTAVAMSAFVIAAVLIALALLHPAFRHVEGHLAGRFVLPLAAAAGVAVIGLSFGTAWFSPARWFALVIVGQAAALQQMRAGMLIGYQHYAPFGDWLGRDLLAVLLLVLQTVLVSTALRGQLRNWTGTVSKLLNPSRIAFVALAFVLTSATLSKEIPIYAIELVIATIIQLINLATVVLAVLAIPEHGLARVRRVFDRLLTTDESTGASIDRFAVVAALWVFIACGFLAWFVYQNHPHVPDEVVYLYHARYFAKGMMSMPLPPVPAAFQLDLMTYEPTRWYSPVPPGWPAVLSIGVWLGVPWLVNPALNAIAVLLTYVLLRQIYNRRFARLAVLLLCCSPWFLFMGMNFMTHSLSLVCTLAAAVAVARLRTNATIAWAIPGGVAIGIMAMIRPLEGLTVAVLLGLWGMGAFPWSFKRVAATSALALVSIATGAITLPYNAYLAGDPKTFPLMAYTDSVYGAGSNALGFGANRGLGWPGLDPFPGHGLIDVLVNGNLNAYSVNIELLGWSIGSLLPLLLLLLPQRLQRADRWMLIAIAAIVGVHSFYWFSGGPDFGARYWYLIIVPCIALAARGLLMLGEGLAEVSEDDARTRVLAGTSILIVATLISFVPWRSVDKYYHYRNMRPDARTMAADRGFGRSLVLVRGNRHPDYASAATYNPIDMHASAPIYVWDRDATITRQALQAYRDRAVWILDGPTRTGRGYRVVAGPLRADDLLSGVIVIP